MLPKISVIIPTCNRPELLKKAIFSVLRQSYQDFEIIVIDDGDKLFSKEVVNTFNDNRINYIKQAIRQGGAAARNTGIKAAGGKFIAFLDDDDEWLPYKLEKQMALFEFTEDNIGFCFSTVIISNGKREYLSRLPIGENGNFFEGALDHFSGFPTPTLMIKKYVLDDVGYFDENFPSHQEIELILRISKKYRGLAVQEPLARLLISDHEHIGGQPEKRIIGREMLLRKYFEDFKTKPEILARWYFNLALLYRDDCKFFEARRVFKSAFKVKFRPLYFFHYLSMIFNGKFYRILKHKP
ncbi:MAG: glycosyltransferase family 2 protein [Candidatus Komeilibacteria bacterium]|nr:glycosyltransferase family 2 protein [Candidatus Komeilibacteria bacterium]